MEAVIEINDLRKSFRSRQKKAGFASSFSSFFKPEFREIEAVNGVNFSVMPGERLAFIGPNGAGKSTTIKMMTGILTPTSGTIACLGLSPTSDRKKLSYHIGTVFGQKPQLWYHLPPIDTYRLFGKIYDVNRTDLDARLKYLINAFEIEHLLETPVRKLSLGERMRCEITASLLHRPKILFLDEPTIGLDVVAKLQIREVIRHLNEVEGVTVFLTSHDAGDIESLAHRTMVINYGRVVFDDTTANFRGRYIRTKTVELHVADGGEQFKFSEGVMLEQSKHLVRLEVDLAVGAIERLLNYTVENFRLKDVNIYEPPMEEIISQIYRDGAVVEENRVSPTAAQV